MTDMEEPLRVLTKDTMKVAAGKKLAEWNRKNKEKLAEEFKAQPDEAQKSNLSYGIEAVMAVGVLCLLLHL